MSYLILPMKCRLALNRSTAVSAFFDVFTNKTVLIFSGLVFVILNLPFVDNKHVPFYLSTYLTLCQPKDQLQVQCFYFIIGAVGLSLGALYAYGRSHRVIISGLWALTGYSLYGKISMDQTSLIQFSGNCVNTV